MREDARLVVSLRRRVSALGEKVFPSHWSFLLGELALFCFAVLVLTGLYLAWFYEPSSEVVVYQGSHDPLAGVEMTAAYASVIEITFDTPAGAIVRQTHHWAAVVFVGVLVLHVGRPFLFAVRPAETGALLFLGRALAPRA